MTIENPYQPPTYGTRHLAVERRMAAEVAGGEKTPNEAREEVGLTSIPTKPARKKKDS